MEDESKLNRAVTISEKVGTPHYVHSCSGRRLLCGYTHMIESIQQQNFTRKSKSSVSICCTTRRLLNQAFFSYSQVKTDSNLQVESEDALTFCSFFTYSTFVGNIAKIQQKGKGGPSPLSLKSHMFLHNKTG